MQHSTRHIARILQLSDSHLGPGRDFKLAGINTYQSLGQVLKALPDQDVAPELLAVTGDIAGDGDEAAYHLFNEAMAEQPRSFAWLPGNHDDFPLMRKVLRQPFRRVVELGNWVAIFLVSAQADEVGGHLSETELAELADLLHRYRDEYVLLFMHHMPVEISCRTNTGLATMDNWLSWWPGVPGSGHFLPAMYTRHFRSPGRAWVCTVLLRPVFSLPRAVMVSNCPSSPRAIAGLISTRMAA